MLALTVVGIFMCQDVAIRLPHCSCKYFKHGSGTLEVNCIVWFLHFLVIFMQRFPINVLNFILIFYISALLCNFVSPARLIIPSIHPRHL